MDGFEEHICQADVGRYLHPAASYNVSHGDGYWMREMERTVFDRRGYQPYNTLKKGVSGGKSMSFVCAFCGRNGVVIASDSRSSRLYGNELGSHPDREPVKKVFKAGKFVFGVWNDNEAIEHGQGKHLEEIIDDILKTDGLTVESFIIHMHSRLFSEKHNPSAIYNMVFGTRSAASGEYMLYEYELDSRGSRLIYVGSGNIFRACAAPGYVPENLNVDYGMDIEEMERYCKVLVQAVIDVGQVYLDKGMIDYFPIGGDVQAVSYQ